MLGIIQPGYESRIVGFDRGTHDGQYFQPPAELLSALGELEGVTPFRTRYMSARALFVEVRPDSLEALAAVEGVTKVANHIRELDIAKPDTTCPIYY